ncbi:MAG: hypothetical protein ACOYLS_10385 [Polymorphobacter sp.]
MAFLAVLLIFAAMLALALWNTRAALLTAAFFMPWNGLDIDIGLRITVYQLAMAAILLVVAARLTQPGLKPPSIAGGTIFAAFALYTTVWSLLQIGFLPPVEVITQGLRGPTVRAVIQIMLFLFAISPVVIVPMVLRERDDLPKMGRLFIAGCVVLGIIGWLQLAGWYATGSNPLPIGAFGNALGGGYAEARSGAFALEALNIYRMNAFAGEPRDLGVAVIIAMMAVQSHALVAPAPRSGRLLLLWGFLFFTLLATFSTSAIGLWVIGSAALLPACWIFGIKVARSGRQLLGTATALVVPLLLLVAGLEASGIPVLNILAERTVERVSSEGALEDFDLAIIDYLKVAPESGVTGVGLGNIHLYATPYLDPLFALYAEGNVFVAKTQYLRFISEIGIIGLALFLGWYLWLTIRTARSTPPNSDVGAVIPAAAGILVITMGSFQAITMCYALAGGMVALCAGGVRRRGRAQQMAAQPAPRLAAPQA